MSRWGIKPSDFTAAAATHESDEHMIEWLEKRVAPDRMEAANAWVQQQTYSLDRQDAEEGVPGAKPPGFIRRELAIAIAIAVVVLLVAFIIRHGFHM